MSYLEIGGQRHPIPVGEVALGCDADTRVVLGEAVQSHQAMLQGTPDGQVAIRRAQADSEILVNGVRLGPQPTPLLHGDKVEIAGQELLFVDDRRSGSTQFIQAVDPAAMQGALKAPAAQVATASTGGRLVSLTDGREYSISSGSLLIGREAGCDVVIPSKNVSRRHAEIVATPKGYILIDSSTNGTFVNGERVQGQRLLSRADVVRCGDYELRFYADVKAEQPAAEERSNDKAESAPARTAQPRPPAAPPSPEPRPEPPPPPVLDAPPPGAERRLANTMHGIPAVPRPQQPATPPAAAPPEGAETRLSDTMLGVPAPQRPAKPGTPRIPPPAAPAAGAVSQQEAARPGSPQSKLPPRPAQPAAPAKRAPAPPPPAPEPGADSQMYPRTGEKEAMLHGMAAGQVGRERPVVQALASLVVRSGPLKGRRFEIRVPVVNVGRADYNDIVLADESVSTVHAKIQRREGIWVLVDEQSTNGSVVDGVRVEGETVLSPGALITFGTVQTIFQPTDDEVGMERGGSTRVIQPIDVPPSGDAGRDGSYSSGS